MTFAQQLDLNSPSSANVYVYDEVAGANDASLDSNNSFDTCMNKYIPKFEISYDVSWDTIWRQSLKEAQKFIKSKEVSDTNCNRYKPMDKETKAKLRVGQVCGYKPLKEANIDTNISSYLNDQYNIYEKKEFEIKVNNILKDEHDNFEKLKIDNYNYHDNGNDIKDLDVLKEEYEHESKQFIQLSDTTISQQNGNYSLTSMDEMHENKSELCAYGTDTNSSYSRSQRKIDNNNNLNNIHDINNMNVLNSYSRSGTGRKCKTSVNINKHNFIEFEKRKIFYDCIK